MNYDKIGEFIQEKRKEKKLTQKELALKIGVTDKAVSKWERGLGCPDVSILEVLANELDVSILELLKGRIIENEVIKVTEMNDYVKETINYSKHITKEKIKNIVNKGIVLLVSFITIILFVLNIINIGILNQSYEYSFGTYKENGIRKNYELLKNNIKKIKNNQGVFSDEDYDEIVKFLDNINLDNATFIKNKGTKKFKMVDLNYMNYNDPINNFSIVTIANILTKYDKSKLIDKNYIASGVMTRAITSQAFFEHSKTSYKYKLVYIPNEIEIYSGTLAAELSTRLVDFDHFIYEYIYLTNMIMEVGGISE